MEQSAHLGNLDPNHVPDEYKEQYDVIELPSQGILYPNKKGSVKVAYLTTFDENILSSPNIANSGKLIDILLEKKVKDLSFDVKDLLDGDRMAILIFLRSTGLGEIYNQPVVNPSNGKVVVGEIDLSKMSQKKLDVQPDDKGEFDFILPISNMKVKFRLLTGRDEDEVDEQDEQLLERTQDGVSQKITLRLDRQIMEIEGDRDKMKISRTIKKLPLKDSRNLRKYINEVEPGIDFNTVATIQGGVEVPTFLKIGTNFLWPEL
tara:strand:+ start:1785 stop:2570 length:786 start_codon:yes stop_codon:yes gene_type:complete